MDTLPQIQFYRFIPSARLPQRADRSAAGTMPTRAFRFCEAMTSASAFGWYVFPPIGFQLMWDGSTEITWTYDGVDEWYPLKVAQFPGFAGYFAANSPLDCGEFSPPFLAAFKEPGIVQIWTGLVARTAPEWSLLIRQPANLPRNLGYEHYEGIIETDRWFGPLFTNIRLIKTDTPIQFDPEFPFLQVQPVHRSLYSGSGDWMMVPSLVELTDSDWNDFRHTVIRPNIDPDRTRGEYAVSVRKRRKSI